MALTQLNLGSELGLEILHQRWYALVLYQLDPAPTDFMDLRVTVRGISTFNLLLRLKRLKEWGLIETLPEDDYSYRLTKAGEMFHQILRELEDWGNDTLENNLAI
ncbi:winged helix-turn-helix transcriptional regulator [Levilactobacillus fuyuanensis]|uniref:Winged helix-turn-helix transcriptional regulator n=1 Tax=Levilactobacillus fuyuanensis TaxID=2486022 RepID=A0ABW4H3U4_9LACO|nr:winged helix-turn-helix transcriptional regulator [Levilactobacillus fuyuanensis]